MPYVVVSVYVYNYGDSKIPKQQKKNPNLYVKWYPRAASNSNKITLFLKKNKKIRPILMVLVPKSLYVDRF